MIWQWDQEREGLVAKNNVYTYTGNVITHMYSGMI